MTAVSPKGWGIRVKRRNSDTWYLWLDIFDTRSRAIAEYDRMWVKENAYRKDRRAGRVRAVRVKIVEDFQ